MSGSPTLPERPDSFVGRDEETRELRRLLAGARLLTLTGPGGVGKTRLALHAAGELGDMFPDGVVFVDLAPLSDWRRVLPRIVAALGLTARPDEPLADLLAAALAERRALLILDNFEHVLGAGPQIAALLARTSAPRLLVTSRAPLQIRGEQELAVAPLGCPEPGQPLSPEGALAFPAVRLFLLRAQQVRPGFMLDAESSAAIAAICRRLDGLPLAIELAAARTRLLPPRQLLARLDSGLGLLARGARDAGDRHQTLRAAIAWSYELLGEGERRLFRRLAVFAGGWTIEAAEAVGEPGPGEAALGSAAPGPDDPAATGAGLDALEALAEQSLIYPCAQHAGARLSMLETIHAFAAEQLAASGQEAAARRSHAGYFLGLAEQADAELTGPRQRQWMARLADEGDNLHAALAWSLGRDDPADLELGLRLAAALWRFWWFQGRLREGARWLEAALGRCPPPEPGGCGGAESSGLLRLRARLLNGAGGLARGLADYGRAGEALAEAARLWQALGDDRGLATTLNVLGNVAWDQGDHRAARAHYERALALRRAAGDAWGSALLLAALGNGDRLRGDHAGAARRHGESLAIMRELGNTRGIAYALYGLGRVALEQGRAEEARGRLEECLGLMRQIGDRRGEALAQGGLGDAAAARGDAAARGHYEQSLALWREGGELAGAAEALLGLGELERAGGGLAAARVLLGESLALHRRLGRSLGAPAALEGAALLLGDLGAAERAVELLAAAAALREELELPAPAAQRGRLAAGPRAGLDPERRLAAERRGRALALDEALACAHEALGEPAARAVSGPRPPAGPLPAPAPRLVEPLSARELEVLQLLVAGLSNGAIAERLTLSVNTIQTHVRHIYGKLGVGSRGAAVRVAFEHGLVERGVDRAR